MSTRSSKAQVLPEGSSKQATIDTPWPHSNCISEALNLDLESSGQAANAARTECISHGIRAECDTAHAYCCLKSALLVMLVLVF